MSVKEKVEKAVITCCVLFMVFFVGMISFWDFGWKGLIVGVIGIATGGVIGLRTSLRSGR